MSHQQWPKYMTTCTKYTTESSKYTIGSNGLWESSKYTIGSNALWENSKYTIGSNALWESSKYTIGSNALWEIHFLCKSLLLLVQVFLCSNKPLNFLRLAVTGHARLLKNLIHAYRVKVALQYFCYSSTVITASLVTLGWSWKSTLVYCCLTSSHLSWSDSPMA